MSSALHGILLLDKPLYLTSAGAVARAKRLFGAAKAGHTGSLDPLASGLLPICFGEATKFGSGLLDADKAYRVRVRFGERTASADRETPVIERCTVPEFSIADLERALIAFPRNYSQVPPMHSALKQEGKPLYQYARAGVTRERAAREIVIHEMRFIEWRAPELSFDVRCTKGAYIRVLAEDLGKQLGTLAHLAALRRLGVAPFHDALQWSFEVLEALTLEERRRSLLPVDAALVDRRRLDVPPAAVAALRLGQSVTIAAAIPGNVRLYGAEEGFLGLGAVQAGGRVVPSRLLAAPLNRA